MFLLDTNRRTAIRRSDLEPSDIKRGDVQTLRSSRYETVGTFFQQPQFDQRSVDEVEARLKCKKRRCKGAVKIALLHGDKTEGFIGDMP